MTVVPFVEPPVGTLGRPFIIFFLRSIWGSSHDPARVAVAESSLTWGMAALREPSLDDLAIIVGRREVVGLILSAWNALRSADEALFFMAA